MACLCSSLIPNQGPALDTTAVPHLSHSFSPLRLEATLSALALKVVKVLLTAEFSLLYLFASVPFRHRHAEKAEE